MDNFDCDASRSGLISDLGMLKSCIAEDCHHTPAALLGKGHSEVNQHILYPEITFAADQK
jgi:hypothetical protein